MKKLLTLLFVLFAAQVVAEQELLDADDAFSFSARVAGERIEASWDVADGYYMYRDKFRFTSTTPGVELGEAEFPPGKIKDDEFFGRVEIYRGRITASIPFKAGAGQQLELVAHSQGCADIGVCYPPHQQRASLQLAATGSSGGIGSAARSALSNLGTRLGLGSQNEPLDPDLAFQFEARLLDPHTVRATWNIAPDYYLYHDKFEFRVTQGNVQLSQFEVPPGKVKHDEFFGDIQAMYGKLVVDIPLLRASTAAGDMKLGFVYQGCAEKIGICYPPIRTSVDFMLPATDSLRSGPAMSAAPAVAYDSGAATFQSRFDRILRDGNLWLISLAALGAGLLLAFTACMYPMIPILSSIIVGQGEKTTVARSFTLSMVYVQSMALTFGVIGAIIALLGGGVGLQAYFQSPWLLIPFALLFVALALGMFGFYNIQIPSALQSRLSKISGKQQGGSLLGVVIMGVLSALIIGPCGGPILLAALGFAAASGDLLQGFLIMFLLGNGMGLPLLVIGVSGGKLLPRAGDWMNVVKGVAGVILLAIAIVMLERMPSIFPPPFTMFLWAALFIMSAVFLGALEPLQRESTGWRKLWKGLGIVLLLWGVLTLLGGLTGARDVFNPTHGSRLFAGAGTASAAVAGVPTVADSFRKVKTVADLQRELAAARTAGMPVMLDFYADWCVYCKQYEDYIFPEPNVRATLGNFVLLKADVTANDRQDRELMAHVNVMLPPALIFYDARGQEMAPLRIVGPMRAEAFNNHLQRALAQSS